MPICDALRACLVVVALSFGAPAMAFDPTPEISTPAQAFRFGLDAYRIGDLVTAMDAFSYAADRGYIRAKWMLGRMYARGEGVDRDDDRAFEIFADIANEPADDRRFNPDAPFVADAFVALGDYYRAGDQVVGGVDLEAALQMYWEAAIFFNDAEAQYNLAVMFYRGEAGDPDPGEAARWALLSAQAGNPSAQALLGYLLFQGDGLTRQPVVGLAYLHVARFRTGGADPEIRRMHEEALALATETERRTALELADGWLVANTNIEAEAAAAPEPLAPPTAAAAP